jgi:hypothetical protein
MERFPDSHDLISFFECEPTVLDRDVAWAYNHLEFRTSRGPDTFLAVIEPGFEVFRLTWHRDGKELVNLSLEQVCRLDLEMGPGRELLVVGFRRSVGVSELRFQLKPEPHIAWAVLVDGV